MVWIILLGVAVVILAGISLLAYLRRSTAALERIADTLEQKNQSGDRSVADIPGPIIDER